jgi:hypothetical protein
MASGKKPNTQKVEDIFTESYWKRPKPKQTGDVRQEQIFEAVGLALSMWETAEGHFAGLFATLLGDTQFSVGARRVYGSIGTSHGRREALRHAAEVYFDSSNVPQHERDIFVKIIKSFSLAAGRRDDIAHGVAHGVSINSQSHGCFLFPPEYNSERNFLWMHKKIDEDTASLLREKYRYTSLDIRLFAGKFGELGIKALEYNGALYALKQRLQPTISTR